MTNEEMLDNLLTLHYEAGEKGYDHADDYLPFRMARQDVLNAMEEYR